MSADGVTTKTFSSERELRSSLGNVAKVIGKLKCAKTIFEIFKNVLIVIGFLKISFTVNGTILAFNDTVIFQLTQNTCFASTYFLFRLVFELAPLEG